MAKNLFQKVLLSSSYIGQPEQKSLSRSTICEILECQLPGSVSHPFTIKYNASLASYYTAQEEELQPACVFTPKHAADVSEFIRIVTSDPHRDAEACGSLRPQFAIRSGGHAVFSGAANIEGGVTVDLRELDSVTISEDRSVVAIGSGAVWSEVYPRLVPYNLTVMGGRVAGVGVGGFLTGGGISHLSRRHGWACDNVIGYEVVLASGEIVYASEDSYSDLWLALKGGSNNFGVVTRFDVLTRPLETMWGGTQLFGYSDAQLDAQAQAFSDFMDPVNFDDAADMFVGLFYLNPGGTFLTGNVLYYGKPEANPKVYQPFTSLPDAFHNTLRLTNVSDLSREQASTLPPNAKRSINMVYSHKNISPKVYRELFDAWEVTAKELADVEGLQFVLLIQPHPVSDGVNSLGLPPGGEDVVMSVITVAWSNKADDQLVRDRVTTMIRAHESILQREGVYLPWKYLNYADYTQDPIGSYSEEVQSRLKFASMKYDPYGVFQRSVPGGFKLFK